MSTIKINQTIPSLTVQATSGKTFKLTDLKGNNLILYFYPKDSTPGCTLEGQAFRDHYADFQENETLIFGVSKDDLTSHAKFKTNQCFPFELIADLDGKLCELFDVIKEKSMFGKKYRGIERSTFLIDKNGVLKREWRKVKVKGHAREILAAVKSMSH